MTLQIEQDKYYRTRDGRKVGPMLDASRGGGDHWEGWFVGTGSLSYWHDNGSHWNDHERHVDIVAEWVDEPASGVSGFTADSVSAMKAALLATELDVVTWDDGPLTELAEAAVKAALAQQENGPVTKKSVLEAAIQTVADRGVPYGGVEDNFNRIASLWQAHLENRYASPDFAAFPVIDAADVAMMMALMKIARLEANPSHADSWIDVAGYAACGGEIGAKLTLDKSE